MRPEAIQAHLRKQPFVPFRVFLSDGARRDVRHPEMMWVSRIEIGIAFELGEHDIPDRFAYYDPVYIVKIQALDGRRSTPSRKSKRK